jgi:hypothetical protein
MESHSEGGDSRFYLGIFVRGDSTTPTCCIVVDYLDLITFLGSLLQYSLLILYVLHVEPIFYS